jgi:NCS2 family nucleobase:cation symporter-2
MIWTLRRQTGPADVVMPEERLSWPRTIGIGLQHLVAMFGATVLVPLLTGLPPGTTIFFSGVGTLLFLVVVRNRVPSYLGSSFAFITPVVAASAKGGVPAALGGIVAAGLVFFLVGLFVERRGFQLIEHLMPPIVTGTVVALIGLNLAPAARDNFMKDPAIALVTLASTLAVAVALRGFASRLSVFLGVLIGFGVAAASGRVNWEPVVTAG